MVPDTFMNPIAGPAVGDPFVLPHRGRFYLYGTNDGPPLADGRVIPVFRSDDLLHWEPMGGALVPDDPGADHWAPEVLAWNGRFFMVVSFGDVENQGHALWVAEADRPEGPFRLRARISDPSEKFSIDGSWLLDDDGALYLFRCLDFTGENEPPNGTGIVAQPMRDPLTPSGPTVTVLRAHAPWHLFEADRLMPLYGGRRFTEWTTIEGPAPVKRGGRYYCGYSGGNYMRAYGTGEAVADAPLGPYRDLRGAKGPIFATTPGLVEGPGHFSVVRPDLVHDWLVLHGRLPGEGVRRVWLCPASWGVEGVTIGELTTHPQPAPPRPTLLTRFAGLSGDLPAGWSAEAGVWRLVGEGLRHDRTEGSGLVGLDAPELTGDWVAQAALAFPGPGRSRGGLVIRGGGREISLVIEAEHGGQAVVKGGGGDYRTAPLPPARGEPFLFPAFHELTVRAEAGRAEVRIDGVRIASDLDLPPLPARLGLYAEGLAVFDAVTVTLFGGPRPVS